MHELLKQLKVGFRMEVKVTVEGVPRIVCGVTENTTCQEVVISLAQALGRPGRYTLKEKFKDFERNLTPHERLLESLEKYGQQAREVQLTLQHNGPLLREETSRVRGGRYQACPQLRRTDMGGRVRRDSGALSSHRQSLPPLSRLRQQAEQPPEELKKPKRKSLTLMEEAWGWLESLGRGGAHQLGRDKGSSKNVDKKGGSSLNLTATIAKEVSASGGLQSKMRGDKCVKSTEHQRISCCLGDQGQDRPRSKTITSNQRAEDKDGKHSKRHSDTGMAKTKAEDQQIPTANNIKDENRKLRALVTHQQASLQELQVRIISADTQINELEEKQKARQADQEAQQRIIEEETEQLQFWENELRAEEGYEKDLQEQFLKMKEKAMDCKAKLEEYKRKMQRLDPSRSTRTSPERQMIAQRPDCTTPAATDQTWQNETLNQRKSSANSVVNTDRKLAPQEDSNLHRTLVSVNQIKDSQPSGPSQLREWWTHWSEAHILKPETKPKVVHRSEITIHLGSTRV